MVLIGVLGSDAVEGGCLYVLTTDGTKYELVFPGGSALPPGVAPGDAVSVTGELARGMASICQVGPILLVAEVVPVDAG